MIYLKIMFINMNIFRYYIEFLFYDNIKKYLRDRIFEKSYTLLKYSYFSNIASLILTF